MRRRTSLLPLFCVLIFAGCTYAQQLTIETEGGKTTTLSRADVESLPRIKIPAGKPEAQYEGVALHGVLEKAGVTLGDTLKGKRMASYLLVEAADGYRVVFALPELDPAFTEKSVILAFLKDGKPLDDKEGPFRVVIPEEKRMARWVRQVTRLKVVDVP